MDPRNGVRESKPAETCGEQFDILQSRNLCADDMSATNCFSVPIDKKTPGSGRNYLLDFIKIISAVFVIITHLPWSNEQRNCPIFPLLIDMAVPFFMVVSGYVESIGISRYGIRGYFAPKRFFVSFIGILLPYVCLICLETVLKSGFYFSGISKELNISISWLMIGLSGPGSYYIPILFQMMLYFPMLFFFMRRKPVLGLLVAFVLNLLFEIYVYHYGVSVHLYRLLIFRYTFLIASGIYLYQTKDKRFSKAAIAVSYCIGVTYIILNRYVYEFVLFGKWKSTSMFVAFYVFAIMVVLLRRYGNIRKSKFVVMGEASLHVFLMQKVWYGYGFPAVYKMTGSKTDAASLLVWGAINILICFSSGLLFFKLESTMRRKVISMVLSE